MTTPDSKRTAPAPSPNLEAFLTTSSTPVQQVEPASDIVTYYPPTETPGQIAGRASLVQPKETTAPKRIETTSLVQPGANPPKRSTRIRGSERGA